jgi:hypothetical protein
MYDRQGVCQYAISAPSQGGAKSHIFTKPSNAGRVAGVPAYAARGTKNALNLKFFGAKGAVGMAYKIYEVPIPFAMQPAVIVVALWQTSDIWRIESFLLAPGASEFQRCSNFEVGNNSLAQYNAVLGHVEPALTIDEDFVETEALKQAMVNLVTAIERKYGTPGVLNFGELKPSLTGLRVFASLFQHADGRAILSKLGAATEDVELGNILQQFDRLQQFSRG